ncbi:MAG: radical SAM protein, partial [Candidatus Diapherotrites archaeon]|nr:radical SAM protein [Candidatus Diapherotrites archaeon]
MHCYGSFTPKETIEMRKDDAFVIIKKLSEAGIPSLGISGGEPLTHPNFLEIVDFASKQDLYLVVSTNGFLLSDSI